MTTTPNLSLPQMPQNSLQPSTPYNAAMQLLDAVAVLVVLDKDLAAPPTTTLTDAGKRWIVGAAATGAWAGHDNAIALCTGADLWLFIAPGPQWRGWVIDEGKYYRFNGAAWVDDAAAGAIAEAPIDGTPYNRQDGAWTPAATAGAADWGSIGGALADQTDLQAVLDGKLATTTRGVLNRLLEQTAAYTLTVADVAGGVRITSTTDVPATIPAGVLPVLCSIPVFQGGAGKVTLTAGGGVTLEAPNGAATASLGDYRVAFQRAPNIWVIG